jgi:hypothetical protein
VLTFRLETNEIPKVVVSALPLRNFVMWLRLDSMNYIWKLHSILNEEYRYIVANKVPVAFWCVKFHSKAADIPHSVLYHI